MTRISALWKGDLEFEPAKATICETAAIALKLMGQSMNQVEVRKKAESMWASQDKNKFS